ncbi:MAG: thiamine diphosphokinase [Pseudomonadota bacterium]
MIRGNVQSSRGVTLVGAGAPSEAAIRHLLSHAPVLVAADGGANACHRFGLSPEAVIGDFDSVDPTLRDSLRETQFIHVTEQDSTDFEKSLTNIDAPFILATGFTSARLDHTLAALSALAQHEGRPVIVFGEDDIVFAAPERLTLDLSAGTRVSLFPMAPIRGQSTGLKWPLEGLNLAPNGRIGTSNEATGPVTLKFDAPGCLVILPPEALPSALAALTG